MIAPYTILYSSRAKRIRLTINGEGAAIVTVPKRYRNNKRIHNQIDRFVFAKRIWIERKTKIVLAQANTLNKPVYPDFVSVKELALKQITDRVRVCNQIYGFSFKSIRVKDTKSRWGSCSKQGNLNFNYRLAFLPLELMDYVIVHELCHLKELNHSPRFWALVVRGQPNYLSIRKRLRSIAIFTK